MFKPEDFEMPLEKQLRIRVIDKEIDECSDIQALRENLKQCACSLMKYQHLLSVCLRQQLISELEKSDHEVSKIIKEALESEDGTRWQT